MPLLLMLPLQTLLLLLPFREVSYDSAVLLPSLPPPSSSLRTRCVYVCAQGAPPRHKQGITLGMKLQPGICPFPVLGFWGKNTMPYAGTMAYRRYFPSTTSI